jgi:hypothetical protein
MRREFDVATMAKVGIKFEPEAIYKWLEWVEEMGDKLDKSLGQRRKRFLEGFPSSFEMIVGRERMVPDPGSFTIANHYPSHHPKSGELNPNRGKPDLDKLVAYLEPEWTRMCVKGIIKPIPRGSVYAASEFDDGYDDHESHDDDCDDCTTEDAYAVSSKVVNDRFICLVCGGRGHAANVDGMECLTKQLGINIPRSELSSTIYPKGLKYPSVKYKDNKKSPRPTTSKHHADKIVRSSKPSSKKEPRRRNERTHRKSAHQSESVERESRDDDERDDEHASSDSDGSAVAQLAVAFNTIDTTKVKYRNDEYHSFDSESQYSSSDDDTTNNKALSSKSKPSVKKSATTKANEI